jgi:8-oxo-dGTP pyrophosphatase MutT (NUDIX family)
MKNEINPWTIISSEEKYDNPWINLTEYQVINPNGGKGIYGKVHFKNLAIGILPINDKDEIVLIGQYRFPLDVYSWEIPEGGGKIGIDPLESAKRELLEETGLKANRWAKLLEMHLSNSVSDELAIIYVAEDLEQFEAEPEETEQLEIKKVAFEEALKMVMDGEITDSMTVAAILKYQILRTSDLK